MLRNLILAVALGAATATSGPAAYAAARSTSTHSDEGPSFVHLPMISLPIIKGSEVVRQVTIELTLELGQGINELAVDQLRPRLIQAFIDDMTRIYEKTDLATQTIDAVAMKKKLQASADRVLGSGVVTAVLIQQAMERAAK